MFQAWACWDLIERGLNGFNGLTRIIVQKNVHELHQFHKLNEKNWL